MAEKLEKSNKRQSSNPKDVGKSEKLNTFSGPQEKQARIETVTPNGDKNGHITDEGASLAAAFEQKVRPFIDLIDNLRCHGLDKDISLPSVVVIGDQSSGKSSILEAISGVQLPRGSGIVTRCPLEMQLKKSSGPVESWFAQLSYSTTDGQKKINVKDRKLLDQLIKNAQDEIAGSKKGISSSLITLRVESPLSPDLTLIDLPGIARTPVEGQPLDICQQIKNLLTEYIKKRNTIILCVLPCIVDIATNEALSMAKEVDSEGIRTLGVLTKPDLIDKGNEADIISILNNEKFVLKKGYLIVRCRGQMDIKNNVDLDTALAQESRFFEQHHTFRDVPEEMRGTKQLAQKLTTILVEHIRTTLPEIQSEVRAKLEIAQDRIEMLGESPSGDESNKRHFLLKRLEIALNRIKRLLIDSDSITNESIDFCRCGLDPKLMYNSSILWREDAENLKRKIEYITRRSFSTGGVLSEANVSQKLKFSRGNELPGFISYQIFVMVVREHISQYKTFCRDFLNNMVADVEELVGNVFKEHFSRLPYARGKCLGVAEEVRLKCKAKAKKLLDLELRRETLIYTQDKTFEDEIRKLEIVTDETLKYSSADCSKITRSLLQNYIEIVNRRFLDNIPLIFRMKLHYDLYEELQQKLQRLCSGPDIGFLTDEDPEAMLERRRLNDQIKRLSHASFKLSYNM